MKKTFLAMISATTMYCGNIGDVYAADSKDLFRERWSEYIHLRDEIGVMNLPDSEKKEKAKSLNAQTIRELSHFVIDELIDVSREPLSTAREPLSTEDEGVLELISLIQSKGIKIDEVRFVDALSLSRHFTDKATKDRIISMLSTGNEKECKDFINEGFKNSIFSNSYLKSKVRETIEQGCAQSKSFRDALVAAFGQVTSGSSKIFDQMSLGPTLKSSDHMIFEDGTWPRLRGNIITLIQNLDDICKNSFFHSRHSQKRTGTGSYAVKHDDISVLYHEIGHFLSADFLKSTEIFGINETIKLIALLSNNLTFNEKALNDFFELLKTAPKGIVQEKCIVDCLLGPVFAKARGLDLIKALITRLGTSNKGKVQLLYLSSVEIFQILGLALVRNGRENILLINRLCDLALAAELGLLIRSDHYSFVINPDNKRYDFLLPRTPFVNHSINLDFYGAMLKVFGSSMQQYMMKIMYGDNLPHALMMEWGLVKTCIVLQYLYNMLHTQASTAIVQRN